MGGCPRAVVASLGITLGVLTGCGGGRSTAPPTPSAIRDDAITVALVRLRREPRAGRALRPGARGSAGYQVRRAIGLGPRELVGPALALGLVELVPEYAGTALEFLSLGSRRRHSRRRPRPTHGARAGRSPAGTSPCWPPRRRRTPTPSSSPARRPSGDAPAAPERPRRRGARLDLRRSTGVPDPSAVPGRAASSATGCTSDTCWPSTPAGRHDAPGARARAPSTSACCSPPIRPSPPADLVALDDDRGLQPAENVTPLVRTEVVDRWGADVTRRPRRGVGPADDRRPAPARTRGRHAASPRRGRPRMAPRGGPGMTHRRAHGRRPRTDPSPTAPMASAGPTDRPPERSPPRAPSGAAPPLPRSLGSTGKGLARRPRRAARAGSIVAAVSPCRPSGHRPGRRRRPASASPTCAPPG